ncbi:MAG: DciA family protein [Coriobacteriales bacterium]|nr:DciA family protein [Coriobacteriales bacterium]
MSVGKKTTKIPERNRRFSSLSTEYLSFLQSFEKKGQATQKPTNNLQIAWAAVAPAEILKHTDNVVYSKRAKNPEILIYVDDSAYAAELTMNGEVYRLKMQEQTGRAIAAITFRVSRTTAQRKQRPTAE